MPPLFSTRLSTILWFLYLTLKNIYNKYIYMCTECEDVLSGFLNLVFILRVSVKKTTPNLDRMWVIERRAGYTLEIQRERVYMYRCVFFSFWEFCRHTKSPLLQRTGKFKKLVKIERKKTEIKTANKELRLARMASPALNAN